MLSFINVGCVTDFREGGLFAPPHPCSAPKMPILNRVKQNSAHIPSLNLIPRLSFDPRFRIIIINGYYTKSKQCFILSLLFILDFYLSSTFCLLKHGFLITISEFENLQF